MSEGRSDEVRVSKVVVQTSEPPVHCIDVNDGSGNRVLRIRPSAAGAYVRADAAPGAELSKDELLSLAAALERLAERA